ncbi:MAG: YtxH domain-containing protein [Xenococcaceae cyanobacterium]
MSKSNQVGAFIGGIAIGSAVGTVLGLLVAPRTGRETRALLKKSADALPELAEDLSTSLQLQADRLSDSTLRNWDETLARLKEAIAAGVEASQIEIKQVQQLDHQERDLNSSIAD